MKHQIIWTVVAFSSGAALTPYSGWAQDTIPDRSSCEKCSIAVEVVGELEDPSEFPIPAELVHSAAKVGDALWVSFERNPSPRLYTLDGKLRAVIGRSGGGPIEWGGPLLLIPDSAGQLAVVDPANARMTFLSASGELIRSAGYAGIPGSAVVSVGGGWIFVEVINPPQARGHPFHYVTRQGEYARSFGGLGDVRDTFLRRSVAPGQPHTFWAALPTQYRLQQWTEDGQRLADIVRIAPWFDQYWDADRRDVDRDPPHPIVTAVREIDGLIWTAVLRPDDNWKKVLRSAEMVTAPWGAQVRKVPNLNELFDTQVEVIDPVTRTLVASTRLDQAVTQILDDGVLVTYGRTDSVVHVQILKVRLVSR